MANNQIQTYADMVNLQVAAEAFWDRLSSPLTQTSVEILAEGNKNNSKEPTAVISLFASQGNTSPRYKLIAHQDLSLNATTISDLGTSAVQNKSGFSASVFLDTVKNEYTLSIRSTEFATSIRDVGDVVADADIAAYSWAFAQVQSMEGFWSTLMNGSATNGVNATTIPDTTAFAAFRTAMAGSGKVNVTGYSLGGNLATAFTELHRPQVNQTYLFNGAGTGIPLGGNFAFVWAQFQQVFANPLTTYPTLLSASANPATAAAWQALVNNPLVNLQGDGIIKTGCTNTVAAQDKGADFLDGGAGDGTLIGSAETRRRQASQRPSGQQATNSGAQRRSACAHSTRPAGRKGLARRMDSAQVSFNTRWEAA